MGTDYGFEPFNPAEPRHLVRVALLPTKRAFTEDLFFCVCMGNPGDMEKAVNDKEYLVDFIRKVSCRPELDVGEVKSVALYR